jgi:hypothetical protein
MNDWIDIIVQYYQIIQSAIQIAKIASKVKKSLTKDYTVDEVKNELLDGEVHFGDKIRLIGTFSEYVPFIDPKVFPKEKSETPLPRTARIEPIDDVYCGAFFKPEQRDAFAEEVLPIFYGIDSKVVEHYTGEMLELQCQIIQVPTRYRDIINQTSYFSLEKEEGLSVPFGLKVLNAEPYGLVDRFRINKWLVGKLDPPPRFETETERNCLVCANLFAYMMIDPVDWPLKYGCEHAKQEKSVKHERERKSLVALTDDFHKVEKELKPFLLFPTIFRYFEIFYPSIDILNVQQNNHSKNVLLGAIQENMERLFEGPLGINAKILIPKKVTMTLDFQYDQVNKITKQVFDPNNVPRWECPHYAPDLKKIREAQNVGKEADGELKIEKKF